MMCVTRFELQFSIMHGIHAVLKPCPHCKSYDVWNTKKGNVNLRTYSFVIETIKRSKWEQKQYSNNWKGTWGVGATLPSKKHINNCVLFHFLLCGCGCGRFCYCFFCGCSPLLWWLWLLVPLSWKYRLLLLLLLLVVVVVAAAVVVVVAVVLCCWLMVVKRKNCKTGQSGKTYKTKATRKKTLKAWSNRNCNQIETVSTASTATCPTLLAMGSSKQVSKKQPATQVLILALHSPSCSLNKRFTFSTLLKFSWFCGPTLRITKKKLRPNNFSRHCFLHLQRKINLK